MCYCYRHLYIWDKNLWNIGWNQNTFAIPYGAIPRLACDDCGDRHHLSPFFDRGQIKTTLAKVLGKSLAQIMFRLVTRWSSWSHHWKALAIASRGLASSMQLLIDTRLGWKPGQAYAWLTKIMFWRHSPPRGMVKELLYHLCICGFVTFHLGARAFCCFCCFFLNVRKIYNESFWAI